MNKKNQMHRRDFLNTTCLGLIGASVIPAKIFAGAGNPLLKDPAKIALQLYTVRDQIKEDIAGTLHRVADTGIEHVETAFWPENVSLKEAARYIKDAGLSVSSVHVELPLDDKKKDAMLRTAEFFGCTKMIWHGWPEDKRYITLAGTNELISIYNEASHFAKSNGLEFGLHNHWWEYRNKVDGRYAYQVLLGSVEPDIFFEIDTYWVKVAGHDSAKIVAEFGKRARLLHIKDGPAKWDPSLPDDHPDPMVAAGKGSQNFPAIVKAANGNTEWMVVEMDNTATDVFAAIKDSYDYLVQNKLGKGERLYKK